jgi:hypothetical protein
MNKLCPACGYPRALQVSPKTLRLLFLGKQRRLFEIVEKAGTAGMPSPELFQRVYADEPDGGPESGPLIINVMINKMNNKLAPWGVMIHSVGYASGYRLGIIKEEERKP